MQKKPTRLNLMECLVNISIYYSQAHALFINPNSVSLCDPQKITFNTKKKILYSSVVITPKYYV